MFFNKPKQNTQNMLESNATLKYSMIFYSFIIGIVSGLIIVVYRILGEVLLKYMVNIYNTAKTEPLQMAGVFALLIIAAVFVAFCVRKEPDISGSGIPQVEGVVTRRLKTNWAKVLVFKFFGGITALAAGLSVGREGPSIQMGAAVGAILSQKAGRMDHERKYLLTSGASAGLAAAFNAPLAGVMFALEEVHKNFSPVVLLSAMTSAVTADMVAKSVFGIVPALEFRTLSKMPLKYYWSLAVLGVLMGLSSYVFNHGVIKAKHIYKKLPVSIEFKIMIPFIFSGIIGMTLPVLIGGGHAIIEELSFAKFGVLTILTFLIIKYLFTFVSFGSGVPGGIFFPLLGLGAMLGSAFGLLCVNYLSVPTEYLLNFAVLAMAAHFAAIVKAPITGIILIFEMTGSFEQLLPLSVVVFTAMVTSDLLGVEPVYDMLLEDILHNKKEAKGIKEEENLKDKKTLLELSVHLGSKVENKPVSELNLPSNCLLVSVQRGSSEIIPRGKTKILAGDMLLVMVNQSESADMLEYMTEITSEV